MTPKAKGKTMAQTQPSDVTEQMAILRDDIRSLSETIAELAQAKGGEMSQAAKDQIHAARDTANAGVDAAKVQAAQLQGQANDFVRDQPAAALGIAAGLGFLVGMLSTRK
ncbi:MAG: DUF883 domain-containing protein [Sulfitobacter sp.]